MIDMYKKFEALARAWSEFSEKAKGKKNHTYGDFVWCRIEDCGSSDYYKTVTFGGVGEGMMVDLCGKVTFSDIDYSFLKYWERRYEKGVKLLIEERAKFVIWDASEKERLKRKEIYALKEKLLKLEGELQ